MSLWTIRFRDYHGADIERQIEGETGFAAWSSLCRERTAVHLDTPGFCSCDIVAAEEPTEVDNAVPEPAPEIDFRYALENAHNALDEFAHTFRSAVARVKELEGVVEELTRERAELLAENARLKNEQAFVGVIAEQSSTGGVWEGDQDANNHD